MKRDLVNKNMLSFIIQIMISIRLLTLPSDLAKYADNNGWICVIISGLIAFIIGYIHFWLCQKYLGLNISQIYTKIYGNIIGRIILVGIAVYIISSIGLGVRLFGEGIKIFLLDKTPMLLIMFLMLSSCLYCLLNGIKTISIVLDILLIPIIIFIIFLIFISFTNLKPGYLLPVLNDGIIPIIKGSLELTDPLLTVGIIGYIVPYFKSLNGIKKYIYMGIGIRIFLYFIITLITIMNFGKDELKYILFPTITLTKSIRMENIFERAESIYMAVWIPVTFTTLLLYYFASTLNLKALFNSRRDKSIIYLQFILFLVISLIPANIAELYNYIDLKEYLAIALFYFIVPVTVIIEIIRSGGKKNE